MMLPTSTYRIQFRNGMAFDRAIECVPYLKALGISHLYASPIFAATSGSTHGYDVTDVNEIEPAIGGRQGFDPLEPWPSKDAGLGLILDIVPEPYGRLDGESLVAKRVEARPGKAPMRAISISTGAHDANPRRSSGKPFKDALSDRRVAA